VPANSLVFRIINPAPAAREVLRRAPDFYRGRKDNLTAVYCLEKAEILFDNASLQYRITTNLKYRPAKIRQYLRQNAGNNGRLA
jgi:hypothetical protein